MTERQIIFTAKYLGKIFAPYYLPIVGMIALFLFSYLSLLPVSYKAFVLILVYIFTVLLPTQLIRFYTNYNGWKPFHLKDKQWKVVPYIISIACYWLCSHLMSAMHIPHFMVSILAAALVIQIVCFLINIFWNISEHMAAIGGVTGALMAFAEMFVFNPVWWLCLLFIIAGVVGTSRMILRMHSLGQVTGGFIIGAICGLFAVNLI